MSARTAIMAALKAAYRRGLPCPSNADLKREIGCASLGLPPFHLKRLHEAGLIELEVFQRGRRIRIVETSEVLQSEILNERPHWRRCRDAKPWAAEPVPTRPRGLTRVHHVAVAPEPTHSREPCFRCGIRADIGCAHNPLPAAGQAPGSHLGAESHSSAPVLEFPA